MNNYQFSDVSHHKGELPFQSFADLGHRLMIAKASDNYNLPFKDGHFEWNPWNHIDAYFVDNYIGARSVGMLAAGYHFARFDRPEGLNNSDIARVNIENYLAAIDSLPPEFAEEVSVGILDVEQESAQLQAAGINKIKVSDITVNMVERMHSVFGKVIFYSGSWWTDQWLTDEALIEIAKLATCWEPEYPSGMLAADGHSINPSFEEYIPTVPNGFTAEFTTNADDMVGKLFAHQYTSGGRVPGVNSNIDLNRTEMSKEELYRYFGHDGTVDPPTNGGTDISGLEADHDEIILNQGIMNTKLDQILLSLDIIYDLLIEEPTEPPVDPPPSDTVVLTTTTEKNRIYLSHAVGYNANDVPIMEFVPTNSAQVSDRVYLVPGSSLEALNKVHTMDGGRKFYKIADYSTLNYMENSGANVPAGYSPAGTPENSLWIELKFLA